jgi:hypothetical protein
MTLQVLFQKLGSSYDDILCRLITEERIIKFLKMFLQDDSYAQLKESLQNKLHFLLRIFHIELRKQMN